MNAPENITLETKVIKVPFISTSDDDLVGSVVSFFRVTPTDSDEDWLTNIVDTATDAATVLPPLTFNFQSLKSASKVQTELGAYQKVTLIFDLQQSDAELWQFYGDGVVFIDEPSTAELRVQTEIKNQGKRLVISVDNVAENLNQVKLAFRYVASRINLEKGAGQLEVYYSQDPIISVGRIEL